MANTDNCPFSETVVKTRDKTICCDSCSNPVDTGRKLNVHKTFRRRPGRLLKVLCTFNLRPVSTRTWIHIK